MPSWPLGAAVVALSTATLLFTLNTYYPMYLKREMRNVLASVQARRQPGDAV